MVWACGIHRVLLLSFCFPSLKVCSLICFKPQQRYTDYVKIVLPILVLIGLAGVYIYAAQRGLIPNQLPNIPVQQSVLPKEVNDQLAILSSRTQELGGHVQNAVGTGIQVNEEGGSLQERAMEYGQYLYCKQVVTGYEAKQASESAQP